MCCRGLHEFANPAYLSGFLFCGLHSVAPYCAPVVSTSPLYPRGTVSPTSLYRNGDAYPQLARQASRRMPRRVGRGGGADTIDSKPGATLSQIRPITPPAKPAAMVRTNSTSDGRSLGQKKSRPKMPATSSPIDRPHQAAARGRAPRAAQVAESSVRSGRVQVETRFANQSTEPVFGCPPGPIVSNELATISTTDTTT